jgi:hypothetical protein
LILETTFDDLAAVTSPLVGPSAARTNLTMASFVSGKFGNAAHFVPGTVLSYTLPPDGAARFWRKGTIDLFFKSDTDAAQDDVRHALVVIGDPYRPPVIELVKDDRLRLELVPPDWNGHEVASDWRAPVWTAGRWVHLIAEWDASQPNDAIQITIDGVRVDRGGAVGGWMDGLMPNPMSIGAANAGGDFSAGGAIDQLAIKGS